jgi:hypothetical protein
LPTDNLTPKQRAAIRRVQEALKLVPVPERRVIRAALRELWQMTAPLFASVQAWQTAMAPALAHIERQDARACALTLAIEERIGHELTGDELITPVDEHRAEVIMQMYPGRDT